MGDPTPAVPVAELIMLAVQDRVELVCKGAVYHSDVGSSVTLGVFPSTMDDLPCAVVFSTDEESEPSPEPRLTNELQVHIEGHATWGGTGEPADPETCAQRMIADIKRAMRVGGAIKDGTRQLVNQIRYVGRKIAYPEDGSRAVAVRLNYSLTYFERSDDPSMIV